MTQRRSGSAPPRLLLITDLTVADEERSLGALDAVLDAVPPPLVAVGLRDHRATARRRFDFGTRLLRTLRPVGARLLVHDRVDLALALDADGVQLGAGSIGVSEARALLAEQCVVAKSCHDARELDAAVDERVDWVTLSPLFASPNKGAPLGEARFLELRTRAPALPVLALGGIDEDNVDRAAKAGADGVAVLRAWLTAPAPHRLAQRLVERFASSDARVRGKSD